MNSKDMFLNIFGEFSRWRFEKYFENFVERLPHRFLEAAVVTNPLLLECDGFDEIQHEFEIESGSQHWRNPELYPYLNFINLPVYKTNLEECINAIRIHTGQSAPDWGGNFGAHRKFWRIRYPSPQVFCIASKEILRVDCISNNPLDSDTFPIIYSPVVDLFDDIEPKLYRGENADLTNECCNDLAIKALDTINRYCPKLTASIRKHVSVIAFMPSVPGEVKSFSKRNYYIGGIFVSARDPISIAEQIIHEYYHQVIWPWWMLECPPDIPSDHDEIKSPITGKLRPVSVMIQALLIYVSLKDFYSNVLSNREQFNSPQFNLVEAEKRLIQLANGIDPLIEVLRSALIERPHCLKLVDHISSPY